MLRKSSTIISSSRIFSRALFTGTANTSVLPADRNISKSYFKCSPFNVPADIPAASSRSTCLGLAGSLSFSMALVTVAESKEPPSPDLIPKEVVLYQYEACPFCNKVKGERSF